MMPHTGNNPTTTPQCDVGIKLPKFPCILHSNQLRSNIERNTSSCRIPQLLMSQELGFRGSGLTLTILGCGMFQDHPYSSNNPLTLPRYDGHCNHVWNHGTS